MRERSKSGMKKRPVSSQRIVVASSMIQKDDDDFNILEARNMAPMDPQFENDISSINPEGEENDNVEGI